MISGHELKPGDVLEGKYRLLRSIGRGGMGVVFEAEHLLLKRSCAVKVLLNNEQLDSKTIARFSTEARSAASIRHANIVEVTDYGRTASGWPFFVMEHLQGETLMERLMREGRLGVREAVEIADSILSGLEYAHRVGVVHRDLKPDNIFLSFGADGKRTVKILDFGIAKFMDQPSHLTAGWKRGSEQFDDGALPGSSRSFSFGTPGYVAPEVVLGFENVDYRADLFSVGVVLYEMLTGHRPFVGANSEEILEATTAGPVIRPAAHRTNISPAMERLVLTALAREADDRIQSAEEFIEYLSAAAVGRTPDRARTCKTEIAHSTGTPPGGATPIYAIGPSTIPPAPRRPSRPSGFSGGRSVVDLKRILLIALAGTAIVGAIGVGSMYISLADRGEQEINQPNSEGGKPTVLLWLDMIPWEADVYRDGELDPRRPLVVPLGESPVDIRVEANGFFPKQLSVVPSHEQTLRVLLRRR